MGFKERRLKHKAEFREEILAAAQEVFSREGYENFSMRKLAARIEHSPTTIYRYFRDKDDLLFHISENLFSTLFGRILEIRRKASHPLEALRLSLLDYAAVGFAHPEQYKVVYFSNPELYGTPDEFLKKDSMGLRFYLAIQDLVRDCIQKGSFRTADAAIVSQALWSSVHGLLTSIIFTKDFPFGNFDVLKKTLVETLLKGFAV